MIYRHQPWVNVDCSRIISRWMINWWARILWSSAIVHKKAGPLIIHCIAIMSDLWFPTTLYFFMRSTMSGESVPFMVVLTEQCLQAQHRGMEYNNARRTDWRPAGRKPHHPEESLCRCLTDRSKHGPAELMAASCLPINQEDSQLGRVRHEFECTIWSENMCSMMECCRALDSGTQN